MEKREKTNGENYKDKKKGNSLEPKKTLFNIIDHTNTDNYGLEEKNDKITNSENLRSSNIFDTYDISIHKKLLKNNLDNGIINDKEYLNEVMKLPIEERSISDYSEEQRSEYSSLEKHIHNSEKIKQTIEFIKILFNGKKSKLSGEPLANHSINVAAILAKYNTVEKSIIVGLLHDVIEDIEDGENKLRAKGYSEEIISLVKELSEDKSLTWKERKLLYLEHLKEASADIKIISAADKLHNTRSFLDDYLIEQDNMRNKFNAGKNEQIELLKNYLEALKNNFHHPIADELEDVIKRFLRLIQ